MAVVSVRAGDVAYELAMAASLGDFETAIDPWSVNGTATLERINTDSYSGSWCLRITAGGTTNARAVINAVANPTKGAVYRSTVWYKAGTVGEVGAVTLWEVGGPSAAQGTTTTVTLTTEWQRLETRHAIQQGGRTLLQIYVGRGGTGVVSGEQWLVDGVLLAVQPSGSAPSVAVRATEAAAVSVNDGE